jgi:hypothetical protein
MPFWELVVNEPFQYSNLERKRLQTNVYTDVYSYFGAWSSPQTFVRTILTQSLQIFLSFTSVNKPYFPSAKARQGWKMEAAVGETQGINMPYETSCSNCRGM